MNLKTRLKTLEEKAGDINIDWVELGKAAADILDRFESGEIDKNGADSELNALDLSAFSVSKKGGDSRPEAH